jgi:hypothetical protein
MKKDDIFKPEIFITDRKQPSEILNHRQNRDILSFLQFILIKFKNLIPFNIYKIYFLRFPHINIFLEQLINFLIYKEIYKHFKRPKLMSLPNLEQRR